MKKHFDDPELWAWAGKWMLIGYFVYQLWDYIVIILASVGGLYLLKLWRDKS